jgi:hypothetical protein
MAFDFSKLKKGKKEAPKSISGGLHTASRRPSMGKGQSTKAADALASMGFGKGIKSR